MSPTNHSPPSESHAAEFPEGESEERLFERAKEGSHSALGALFGRYTPWLRRWTRGRLPAWARDGIDTDDLVQDALHQALPQVPNLRSAHSAALRLYLRRTIENQIIDQMRRATVRLNARTPSEAPQLSDEAAPHFRQPVGNEIWERYLEGLKELTPRHRRLVVGRIEFGYSYRQLALIEELSTPDAARMAFRRGLVNLSRIMRDR